MVITSNLHFALLFRASLVCQSLMVLIPMTNKHKENGFVTDVTDVVIM